MISRRGAEAKRMIENDILCTSAYVYECKYFPSFREGGNPSFVIDGIVTSLAEYTCRLIQINDGRNRKKSGKRAKKTIPGNSLSSSPSVAFSYQQLPWQHSATPSQGATGVARNMRHFQGHAEEQEVLSYLGSDLLIGKRREETLPI